MTILLINANPVVSRLFTLCTRDDDMLLETVSDIDEASEHRYDVLFVDEASCEGDIAFLSTKLDVGKKVYLSYSDEPMAGFDETIKKPFLPSQIIDVLNDVEVREFVESDTPPQENMIQAIATEEENDEEVPSIFPLSSADEEDEESGNDLEMNSEVLDRNEIEKIKSLLEMDDEETQEVDLSDETYESRKIEVIKEQLIADGLEIFEEEEIVDVIHEANELKKNHQKREQKSEKALSEKKKKNMKISDDDWEQIETAIENAIYALKPKKMKKLLKGKEIEMRIKLEDKE